MSAVAIITRTKNREILLGRALESVQKQTFRDFVWVVVNDGGEQEPVDQVVSQARAEGLSAEVIHNPESLGMEAASNVGVRASASEFIVIHDDDDSWQPTFLERTVDFLRSEHGANYGGVVTHSIKVEEVVEKDSCKIKSRYPFNSNLEAVELFQIAKVNSFPPISFLYRRKLYDELDGYDETLTVLGDWDFNLRFLLRADIAVMPELLANYHHRIQLRDQNYGNTIIHGVDRHREYSAIIRNRLLRQDISEQRIGLGLLVNIAPEFRYIELSLPGVEWLKGFLADSVAGHYYRRFWGRKPTE